MEIEEAYESVKGLVHDVVYRFLKTYGGDLEELKSVAYTSFTENFYRYDREKAKLTTWIRNSIYRDLVDYLRLKIAREKRWSLADKEFLENYLDERVKRFKVKSFLEDLSSDARLVITIVLHNPKEVKLDEKRPKGFKKVIKNYLIDIGWSLNRVIRSFKEIKEALWSNKGE